MSTLPGEGARKKQERSTTLTFRIRSGSPNFFILLQSVVLSYHSIPFRTRRNLELNKWYIKESASRDDLSNNRKDV